MLLVLVFGGQVMWSGLSLFPYGSYTLPFVRGHVSRFALLGQTLRLAGDGSLSCEHGPSFRWAPLELSIHLLWGPNLLTLALDAGLFTFEFLTTDWPSIFFTGLIDRIRQAFMSVIFFFLTMSEVYGGPYLMNGQDYMPKCIGILTLKSCEPLLCNWIGQNGILFWGALASSWVKGGAH